MSCSCNYTLTPILCEVTNFNGGIQREKNLKILRLLVMLGFGMLQDR